MSSTYAGADSFPASFTIPDDGDDENASSINTPLEALGDRTVSLHDSRTALASLAALTAITTPSDGMVRHVLGFGLYVFKTSATTGYAPFRLAADDLTTGGWVSSTAHETTRTIWVPAANAEYISRSTGTAPDKVAPSIAALFCPLGQADIGYDLGVSSIQFALGSTDASKAWGLLIPIDEFVIAGATLASATLKYAPNIFHGGDPTHFPRLALVRMGQVTATSVALLSTGSGLVTDSGGTYIAERSLVLTTDQNNVIDPAYSYAIQIWSECGTNASAFVDFHGVVLAFTGIPSARR